MSTIKNIFESLQEEDRARLLYGFEHEFAQYVCLPDNKFIGVNITNVQHLEITQEAGVWAIGNVKGTEPSCNT